MVRSQRPIFFLFFFFSWCTRCTLFWRLLCLIPHLYGWRLENSTQKPETWFTGLRRTAGLRSPCLSPGQTETLRTTVRTLCATMMSRIDACVFIYIRTYRKKPSFFVLNRCGLVISYQRQPWSVMLPLDSGWQNIQRSGSSIRRCQVAEGYARIFHPTSVVCCDCSPQKRKKTAIRCHNLSNLIVILSPRFYDHGFWRVQRLCMYVRVGLQSSRIILHV